MIYLDYAAHTPVDQAVLDVFCEVTRNYPANPNSSYRIGKEAADRLAETSRHMATLLGVSETEIIFTSGATESNNLAIKGIAAKYKRYGKHIITTYLEHSSVTGAVTALKNEGFEVDFVDITAEGTVDMAHLKELLRDDTVLVSVCYVDSEIGIRQPIREIGELVKQYPHCYLHVDATQAVGKIPIEISFIDLMTFSPHKFYGMNSSGVLIRKEHVMLEPLIHGGISTTPFRSGTPDLAMAVAADAALTSMMADMEEHLTYVTQMREILVEGLTKHKCVHINSTATSVPYILNLSLRGINSHAVVEALEEKEIYISTKSACCAPNTASRPVYAITKDKKLALSTLRISMSHKTTREEIDTFLDEFDACIKALS